MQATTRWLDYMETQAMHEKEEKTHLAGNLPEQIRLFIKSTIKQKSDGIGGGKNARSQGKRNTDADHLENMPPPDKLMEACSLSMAYLEVILDFIQRDGEEHKDWNYVKLATELMVGLIFVDTLAGTICVNHGCPGFGV